MTELIMVHGTWSNHKIWESPFARQLATLLHVHENIQSFEWSGRNSVTAREKASSDFIEFVRKRSLKEPPAQRVIVCHSHGGSIVMRALAREPDLPIDALVCIGTPFIHVSRLEEVVPGAVPPFRFVAAALAIVFVLALARILELLGFAGLRHALAWMWNHPIRVIAWLFGTMLAYMAILIALQVRQWVKDRREGRVGEEEIEEYVNRLLEEPDDEVWALKQQCRLPTAEPVPTLLIRTPGDEAHGSLAAAQMASLLARTLYNAPLRVLGKALLGRDGDDVGITELPLYYLLWWIAFVWRAFVSIPVTGITFLAFLPFGIEFSRLAGRVLVAAGDAPPGSWTVTYLAPFDRYEERLRKSDEYVTARMKDDEKAVARLETELESDWKLATQGIAHSRAYNDLRSAAIIANWIDQQLHPADTPSSGRSICGA